MRLFWHPKTAETRVFGPDETPPADWLDHHPADPGHAAPEPAPKKKTPPPDGPEVEKPMAREELAAALKAGGIAFPDDAKDDELHRLLVEGLRTHLTGRKIAFDMLDGPRKLLSLASGA